MDGHARRVAEARKVAHIIDTAAALAAALAAARDGRHMGGREVDLAYAVVELIRDK